MALQVWLPLNGNLNNQGLNNTTFTGSTTFEAGKLGQAGVFGTAAKRAISSATVTLNSQVTIAFWIKIKTWVNWGRIFNLYNSDKTNTISCVSNTSTDKRIGTQVSKNGTNLTDSYNGSFDLNTWYHFTMVVDGTTKQHYINGSLVGTATLSDSMVTTDYTIMCGGTADGGTPVNMDINDFRVYDHALSPKEIEILSRGLVCHYPLNGGGRGGDNIISGTSPNEVQYTYPSSSYSDKFSKTSTIIPSASQYVLSFWAKSTHAGDKVRAHWYSPNTTTKSETNQGSISTAADGQIDFTLSDKWEKYWCVWTQSSTTAVKHFIFPRMFSQANGEATGTGTVSVKCVKLEEGNIPTPWMPNSADTAYSAMGYNSTTEYDVSGYGYNGTKNGTLTYSSDTARYNVSTKFASTTYIETPSPCSNVRSASFWIKTDKTAYAVAWADAKSKLAFGIVSSGDILVSCNNGATKKYPNSVIAANVWQHIVIVRGEDIANTDLYVNGVKQTPGTSTDFWAHTSDSLIINGRGYSTPSRMNSQMSDFRLYATALSAAQVAELYNTAVSVANNGTLMGYELVEV